MTARLRFPFQQDDLQGFAEAGGYACTRNSGADDGNIILC